MGLHIQVGSKGHLPDQGTVVVLADALGRAATDTVDDGMAKYRIKQYTTGLQSVNSDDCAHRATSTTHDQMLCVISRVTGFVAPVCRKYTVQSTVVIVSRISGVRRHNPLTQICLQTYPQMSVNVPTIHGLERASRPQADAHVSHG